jgi:hypothetical protein
VHIAYMCRRWIDGGEEVRGSLSFIDSAVTKEKE